MIEDIENLIMIGDRVLLKPMELQNKTSSGLYLPPSVKEKDEVYSGEIIKVGPGYPIPVNEIDSFLHDTNENKNFLPLQVKVGDRALYVRRHQLELEINEERFVVVQQSAILLVFRPNFEVGGEIF